MTTFAFDLHETITAAPEPLALLMRALRADGHLVVIVTGNGKTAPSRADQDKLDATIAGVGLVRGRHFDALEVVWGADDAARGREKARVCRAYGAVLLFDDRDAYAAEVVAVCPVFVLRSREAS